MKRFIFFLLLLPPMVNAQLIEHFDDYDFTNNPVWWGDVGRFVVNEAQQLQLNDQEAASAYLATAYPDANQLEWQCWVKAGFSPSSNNFIRIFLMSNEADLNKATSAYYVQLGESGNEDAVELFRLDGTQRTSICRGPQGAIASAFDIRLKITRDTNGHWDLYMGSGKKGSLMKIAWGEDNTLSNQPVFGFLCRYTSSNAKKMFFDDIYVGPPQVDSLAPFLKTVRPLPDSSLTLSFNEALYDSIAEECSHYELVSSGVHPYSAVLLPGDTLVKLRFLKPFTNGVRDSIAVSGLEDLSGNKMGRVVKDFFFYIPEPFDVVVNEIMADPTPAVGLPEEEYLELFNRKTFDIHLDGWQLVLGNGLKVFGSVTIPARGFLLLGKKEASDDLQNFGLFYGFSSFSLPNTGSQIELIDSLGKIISRVTYADSWYHNPDKANGGWSLEAINPDNACSGEENWTASTDYSGGTPGKKNAVYDENLFSPFVSSIQVVSSSGLLLTFSQQMDRAKVLHEIYYTVNPENRNPDSVSIMREWPTTLRLHFPLVFDTSLIYELKVNNELCNCQGIDMEKDTVLRFGMPQRAEVKDIVINEVLFHPLEGGVDYVELYNRSAKVIDLSKLELGYIQQHPPAPDDTLFFVISQSQRLMLPGQYLVLTLSPDIVKKQYVTTHPEAFLRMNSFPGLSVKQGRVLLVEQGCTIDFASYSEDMQDPLLNSFAGVALERVSFDGQSGDPNNWHSASQSVGFGTPGYQNSQFLSDSVASSEIIIDPAIFSPDNDGHQDNLSIKYHFNRPGNRIQIVIFNRSGQQVKHLVNNQYVGTSGLFIWNGLMENNTKAPPGVYIFYIKVFDINGLVKAYKRVAVLAPSFK